MLHDLDQLEVDIQNFRNTSTWVDSCERLLEEVQRLYKEGRQSVDDSELAGEVKLLRERCQQLRSIDETCVRAGISMCHTTAAQVQMLADAYRSEKDRADRLQAQLDNEQDRANLATALANELQSQLKAVRCDLNNQRELNTPLTTEIAELKAQLQSASTATSALNDVLMRDGHQAGRLYADVVRDIINHRNALEAEVSALYKRVATLQAQLDAQPQVEAIAYLYHSDEPGRYVPTDGWFSRQHGVLGYRRRLFAGPPEPIASEVK